MHLDDSRLAIPQHGYIERVSSKFSFLPVFLRIQAPWFFGSHYTTLLLNCQFIAYLFAGIFLFFCELENKKSGYAKTHGRSLCMAQISLYMEIFP